MEGTVRRVRRLTVEQVNTRIRSEAEARVAYYANHPEEIDRRLQELNEEWDIERAIEVEAAATVLTGFLLGATISRKWFILPVIASGMLLLHNVHGAYPWLPLFRRLGFRTAREISAERYALKALRGDFEGVGTASNKPSEALEAAGLGKGDSHMVH